MYIYIQNHKKKTRKKSYLKGRSLSLKNNYTTRKKKEKLKTVDLEPKTDKIKHKRDEEEKVKKIQQIVLVFGVIKNSSFS